MVFRVARAVRNAVYIVVTRTKMLAKAVALSALTAVLWRYTQLSWYSIFGSVCAAYLGTGGWKFARIVIRTFARDAR